MEEAHLTLPNMNPVRGTSCFLACQNSPWLPMAGGSPHFQPSLPVFSFRLQWETASTGAGAGTTASAFSTPGLWHGALHRFR